MPRLASAIRDYYYQHINELPADKQFHFASRLSSWSHDPTAIRMLDGLQSKFITQSTQDDLLRLINNPPEAKINAAERRKPYFDKYPQLRGLMLALFRVRHMLYHYDTDIRDTLLLLVPKDELYALSDALQQDTEAVSILSTYAINYIYLVECILYPRSDTPLQGFLDDTLELADTYGDTPEDSLLLIYLFTHCIIGASNFYQKTASQPVYRAMLDVLEGRIQAHFNDINLDNKFEFLVSCQITSFNSKLSEQIEIEAQQSLSPEGTFLIDTHNTALQGDKTSFSDSEHRNVLYIMSQTPFIQSQTLSE